MPTVAVADLERLTADLFAAHRVPRDDAAWIATLLVRANLRGHDSHGAIRIPQYCAAIKAGHLNPTPALRVVTDTPTLAIVDGDQGFGQVVARRGVALAVDKARTHGVSAVALRRTSFPVNVTGGPPATGTSIGWPDTYSYSWMADGSTVGVARAAAAGGRASIVENPMRSVTIPSCTRTGSIRPARARPAP